MGGVKPLAGSVSIRGRAAAAVRTGRRVLTECRKGRRRPYVRSDCLGYRLKYIRKLDSDMYRTCHEFILPPFQR